MQVTIDRFRVAAITTVVALCTIVSAFAVDPAKVIKDFYPVVPDQIYRSAIPSLEGLKALKENGILHVVSIDDHSSAAKLEAAWAKELGITFDHLPMSGVWTPKAETVDKVLALLNAASVDHKILIHCKHGHDRTGLLVGLYRVETQKWDPSKAYAEMLARKFHRTLIFLNNYFLHRVGWTPKVNDWSSMINELVEEALYPSDMDDSDAEMDLVSTSNRF